VSSDGSNSIAFSTIAFSSIAFSIALDLELGARTRVSNYTWR
jgi:hypothetical protein